MLVQATTAALCGGLALTLAGCGAAGDVDDVETDVLDLSDPSGALTAEEAAALADELAAPTEGEIGQVQQALSVTSCDSVVANRTFTGMISPEHISPRNYTTCYKGYVVDLDNISSSMTGSGVGGGPDAYIHIRYADLEITNRAACEATELRTIVYTRQLANGNWDESNGVYDSRKYGSWVTELTGISPPSYRYVCSLGMNVTGMTAGSDYRFAMTSRTSSGSTRRLGIQTHPRIVLR